MVQVILESLKELLLVRFNQLLICDACKGLGKIPEKFVKLVKVKVSIYGEKTIKIKTPQGLDNGSRIRILEKVNLEVQVLNQEIYIFL
jgi:DnaJ-class molecular chaperone